MRFFGEEDKGLVKRELEILDRGNAGSVGDNFVGAILLLVAVSVVN